MFEKMPDTTAPMGFCDTKSSLCGPSHGGCTSTTQITTIPRDNECHLYRSNSSGTPTCDCTTTYLPPTNPSSWQYWCTMGWCCTISTTPRIFQNPIKKYQYLELPEPWYDSNCYQTPKNIPWTPQNLSMVWSQCQQVHHHQKMATSSSTDSAKGTHQPGGTLTLALGKWASCVIHWGSDDPLGWWSYLELVSQHGMWLIVISAYCVCLQQFDVTATTVMAQQTRISTPTGVAAQAQLAHCVVWLDPINNREMVQQSVANWTEAKVQQTCEREFPWQRCKSWTRPW